MTMIDEDDRLDLKKC